MSPSPDYLASLPAVQQIRFLLFLLMPISLFLLVGSFVAYDRAKELAAKYDWDQVPVGTDAVKLFFLGLCSWPAVLCEQARESIRGWVFDGVGLAGKLED